LNAKKEGSQTKCGAKKGVLKRKNKVSTGGAHHKFPTSWAEKSSQIWGGIGACGLTLKLKE